MRLTKSDKDAFVLAVVQDIPKIDYQEQVRALVYEDSIAQLPAKVQPIARDKALSHYLETGSYWRTSFGSIRVFEARGTSFTLSKEVQAKVEKLCELHNEQEKRLDEARAKLRGAIEPCTTLKIALERLPEFEQYLPKQQEKTVYLPSIANLCADLSKLGWPKDKAAPVKAEKPAKVKTGAGTVIAV
jgi:hypothetical protein